MCVRWGEKVGRVALVIPEENNCTHGVYYDVFYNCLYNTLQATKCRSTVLWFVKSSWYYNTAWNIYHQDIIHPVVLNKINIFSNFHPLYYTFMSFVSFLLYFLPSRVFFFFFFFIRAAVRFHKHRFMYINPNPPNYTWLLSTPVVHKLEEEATIREGACGLHSPEVVKNYICTYTNSYVCMRIKQSR